MQKLEHIGIAVKDLSQAVPLYESLLNAPCYKMEMVESEQVHTAFFRQGETKIELLESLSADGPIGKFIQSRGEGMHHLAFHVEDIRAEMKRLKDAGFILLHDEPRPGADNKWICFLHPKHTAGVLIELCMDRD